MERDTNWRNHRWVELIHCRSCDFMLYWNMCCVFDGRKYRGDSRGSNILGMQIVEDVSSLWAAVFKDPNINATSTTEEVLLHFQHFWGSGRSFTADVRRCGWRAPISRSILPWIPRGWWNFTRNFYKNTNWPMRYVQVKLTRMFDYMELYGQMCRKKTFHWVRIKMR